MGIQAEKDEVQRTSPFIMHLLRKVLDALYPWTTCAACRTDTETHNGLCSECAATVRTFDGAVNIGAAYPAYAAYHYSGAMRRMVLRLKNEINGEFDIARFLAPDMAAVVKSRNISGVLVPIPLHWKRMAKRGFNQSESLAREVHLLTGLPVSTGLLKRVRNTKQQKRLPAIERMMNVRGAFKATGSVKGLSVILIDDIITSGATVRECADALTEAGAAKVIILAACARVRDGQRLHIKESPAEWSAKLLRR